jgi:hypothetical protein
MYFGAEMYPIIRLPRCELELLDEIGCECAIC